MRMRVLTGDRGTRSDDVVVWDRRDALWQWTWILAVESVESVGRANSPE